MTGVFATSPRLAREGRRREVDNLSRRVAHAVYALVAASREHKMPVTAQEIMLYDSEAVSTKATGTALALARRKELAAYTGRYWLPTNDAYELYPELERRFLEDTQEGDE